MFIRADRTYRSLNFICVEPTDLYRISQLRSKTGCCSTPCGGGNQVNLTRRTDLDHPRLINFSKRADGRQPPMSLSTHGPTRCSLSPSRNPQSGSLAEPLRRSTKGPRLPGSPVFLDRRAIRSLRPIPGTSPNTRIKCAFPLYGYPLTSQERKV
jgi:hypothetical protein